MLQVSAIWSPEPVSLDVSKYIEEVKNTKGVQPSMRTILVTNRVSISEPDTFIYGSLGSLGV